MENHDIFDTLSEYAASSSRLSIELSLVADELKRINASGAADDLDAEIKRRATTIFSLVNTIIPVARKEMQDAISDIVYAAPEAEIDELTADEDAEIDNRELREKQSVAGLLGIAVLGSEYDDEETDAVSPAALEAMSDDEFEKYLKKRYGAIDGEASQIDLDDDEAEAA